MEVIKYLEFGSKTPEQENFAHRVLRDMEYDLGGSSRNSEAFSMSRLFEHREQWVIYPKTQEALEYLEENQEELKGRLEQLPKDEFIDSTGLVKDTSPHFMVE